MQKQLTKRYSKTGFTLQPLYELEYNLENIQTILTVLNMNYRLLRGEKYEKVKDIVSGLWSGFPVCCVNEFSLNGNYGNISKDRNKHSSIMMKHFHEAEYVPCDDCLKSGTIVKNIREGVFRLIDDQWLFIIYPNTLF